MAAGDPQRTWFPEMIQKLRAEWYVGMSFPKLIKLCDSLDSMLRDIRSTRKIHSPIFKCPKCGHVGPGGEPKVSVRAMILSLGRFKIAEAQHTKVLEKQWAIYREKTGLICMARLTKANPAGMSARTQLFSSIRICEQGRWTKFPRMRLLDNNDLGTVNIQISLFNGDRTAARSEAGRGFVRPAIHFLV